MSARTADFARHAPQEDRLQELNRLLGVAERACGGEDGWRRPRRPLVFIVGAPRSGTTLTLQWLAASQRFAYPTNLLARFFGAPYIGGRIQQMLTDPAMDYRDELGAAAAAGIDWVSDVGKTKGLLQPHEFSYFWRRFFPIGQAAPLTDAEIAASDPDGFVAGWASIEAAFDKPIAAKGILLQYNLAHLADWLPRAIFVHTRRAPVPNMLSILRARKRVLGTRDAWFSVRPPGVDRLRGRDPYTQVAGQVLFTNRAIARALAALPPARAVEVDYERFCSRPAELWARLQQAFEALGSALDGPYDGPPAFTCTNADSARGDEARRAQAAYERLATAALEEVG